MLWIFPHADLWLRHLIDSMEKMGCDVTRDFFKCLPCNRPVEGFYERRLGVRTLFFFPV